MTKDGETPRLRFETPVTLVGGGALDREALNLARALGPRIIAADGAANRLAELGLSPEAAIGDMDSIRDHGRDAARELIGIDEQHTTDFEKCLYSTEAPLYLAVGFTGERLDHTLAALHVLLARPAKRVVMIGEREAMALAPPGREIGIELAEGAPVSIFPLRPVRGVSRGLRWPIDGIDLGAGERIATSNRATGGPVSLRFEGPGGLVMVERHHAGRLARAVTGIQGLGETGG